MKMCFFQILPKTNSGSPTQPTLIFFGATGFIDGYYGIAILPTDDAALWTGLRETVYFAGTRRSGMEAFFGKAHQ